MRNTKNRLGRALALTAVVGAMASAVGFIPSVANADTQTGQTISVTSGTAGTTFSLGLTAPNNVCQGNTALNGYQWAAYVASSTVDLDAVTVDGGGNLTAPTGFIQNLFDTFGDPQTGKNLSTTGQVVGTSTMNFLTNSVPGNGSYRVGYLCYQAGQETRHWITPITVSNWTSSTSFNWAFGAVPAAPAGSTAVGGDGTITGVTGTAAATPAVTGYTVTATRTSGTADPASPRTTTVGAAGGAYSLTAINGATYTVTVTATNSVGTGPATTITGVTPNFAPVSPAPTTNLTSGPSPITATVSASTGSPPVGVTLVNTVLTVTPVGAAPAIPGSPFTVTGASGPVTLTGAPGNAYTYTVVSNYSDGRQSLVLSGAFSFSSAQVVVQDIQVVRPVGALVLTQRCGVFGSAPAYTDNVFGSLPALGATPSNADPDNNNGTPAVATDDFYNTLPIPTGWEPRQDSAPANPNAGVGAIDPLAAQYPYPIDANGDSIATYPTNCGITLEQARLITSGPRAGQYFRTTGRIAQLTVVNTQNADGGWTLNGRMGNFSNGTDTFSGNLMAWTPEVTWDSLANLDGYNMTVTAGAETQPAASQSPLTLDPRNSTLASSVGGSSLGMAVMDARLRLLIPVSADSGTYRGVLTFTTV